MSEENEKKEDEVPEEKKAPTAMDLYSTFIGKQAATFKPFDNSRTKPTDNGDIAKSIGKKS